MAGRTISLGMGYSKEVSGGFSRSMSIQIPTNFEDEVYDVCLKLFEKFYVPGTDVRNLYVCLSNLCTDEEIQLDMFSF
ncbi:hypothetical protein [Ammoniphilus sp. 3BR4]|uniref:DinB/UmuC family translesion DNA polymerase n=1 Tax=Ammoniphilus sp. 3BR4 TaxID=3158265 RepID=UPI003466B776